MRNRHWWDARRIREEEDTEARIEAEAERKALAKDRRRDLSSILGIHSDEDVHRIFSEQDRDEAKQ